MLDRRFVADNIDVITENCHLRGASVDVPKFAELDILRRQLHWILIGSIRKLAE